MNKRKLITRVVCIFLALLMVAGVIVMAVNLIGNI